MTHPRIPNVQHHVVAIAHRYTHLLGVEVGQ